MFTYEYAGHLQVLHDVKNRIANAVIIINICLQTKYFQRIKLFIFKKLQN